MANENLISMQQLLQALEDKGFLVSDSAIADFILMQPQDSPLYLQILAGIGAFFSTLFLLGFLAISRLISFDSVGSLALGGIAFGFVAILLQRTIEKKDAFSYSFTTQLSFCAMAVSKSFIFRNTLEYPIVNVSDDDGHLSPLSTST